MRSARPVSGDSINDVEIEDSNLTSSRKWRAGHETYNATLLTRDQKFVERFREQHHQDTSDRFEGCHSIVE